jgi:hypothetical protein
VGERRLRPARVAPRHLAQGGREQAVATLGLVNLGPEAADLYPGELSGGMQKRVGLARAIASKPEVLFFDEPTTGLDPITADVINDLIVRSVRQLGATALSITHDMASVRKIADEVAMLHAGRIVWRGPVADLDRSGNEYVDQFVHGRAGGADQGGGGGAGVAGPSGEVGCRRPSRATSDREGDDQGAKNGLHRAVGGGAGRLRRHEHAGRPGAGVGPANRLARPAGAARAGGEPPCAGW